jgi:hypothetical protein
MQTQAKGGHFFCFLFDGLTRQHGIAANHMFLHGVRFRVTLSQTRFLHDRAE